MNAGEKINAIRRENPTNYVELAALAGQHSRDAYWQEFDEAPDPDRRESVGDWDSSAWQIAWHDLRDGGATDADYDACLAAWREAFWGEPAVIVWTDEDMIDATLEHWGDEAIRAEDCEVIEANGCLIVVHEPTGRTSDEAADAGRWNLDRTAKGTA